MLSSSALGDMPVLGAVEMRLSDEDRAAIAKLVAAELREAMGLSDEALSVLRPSKVAELLQVSDGTVAQLERDGKLVPFLRDGRVIRYSRQELAAFLNRGAA